MGDYKGHCLVCDSYTSDVKDAWDSREGCPNCGAMESDSLALERVQDLKKSYISKKADAELIKRNEELEKENVELKIQLNSIHNEFYNLAYSAQKHANGLERFQQKVKNLKSFLEELCK